MNAKEYKKMIQEDIQTLKNLEPDILPSPVFYKKVGLRLAMFYAIIVGIPIVSLMIFRESPELTLSFYKADFIYLMILCSFVSLLVMPKLSEYIVYRETLKPHLKLGALIDAKFKFLFRVFTGLYTLWVIFDTNFLFSLDFQHFGERMFTVIAGFILSVFVATVVFNMELSRVGLASLFDIISALREDDANNCSKKILHQRNKYEQ